MLPKKICFQFVLQDSPAVARDLQMSSGRLLHRRGSIRIAPFEDYKRQAERTVIEYVAELDQKYQLKNHQKGIEAAF